jgi:hypothetical protein
MLQRFLKDTQGATTIEYGLISRGYRMCDHCRRVKRGFCARLHKDPNGCEIALKLVTRSVQETIDALARAVRILHLDLTQWSRQGRAPHPSRRSDIAQRKCSSVRCSGRRRYPGHFLGARRACDSVGQANGKSLLLSPAPRPNDFSSARGNLIAPDRQHRR